MIITDLFESSQQCPECGGPAFTNLILAEKKDACYYKVKASAKVWPSAYASGRLVQCRKKGAANYGNKSEGVAEGLDDDESVLSHFAEVLADELGYDADEVADNIVSEMTTPGGVEVYSFTDDDQTYYMGVLGSGKGSAIVSVSHAGGGQDNELEIYGPGENLKYVVKYGSTTPTLHTPDNNTIAQAKPGQDENDLVGMALDMLWGRMQQRFMEFAPAGSGGGTPPRGPRTPGRDPWGGSDGGEDPYSRPEPEYYARSIDYFGRFEADHFDREDFNDKTGVFKGYWENDDGGFTQIAYFKFTDPQQAKQDFNDSPGMGWYYEPQMEGVTEAMSTASLTSRYMDDPNNPAFKSTPKPADKDPLDSLPGIVALRKTDPARAFRALQDYGFRNPNDPVIKAAADIGAKVKQDLLQKAGITDPRPWDTTDQMAGMIQNAMFDYIEKNLPQQDVAEASTGGVLWRVHQPRGQGGHAQRYYVVKGYDKHMQVWKNKIGAGDFIDRADAKAKAEELNKGAAEGIEGEIAGGVVGTVVGGAAGSTLGPIGGAIGSTLGGSVGSAIGSRYQDGKPLKEKQQLDEFAPLLAAGARLFMAAAPKIAQVVGRAGRAGAQGAGQAAKTGAEIAAKNAGQIGLGAGAYEIGSSVADIAKDITAKVGTAIDEKTVFELATMAFKYAIPAGIVLAILYGGKKAIDSLFSDRKEKLDMTEGGGDPDIRAGMKTNHGTVVKVNGNTVTVKSSNGELTTVNIHDIQQGVAEGIRDWFSKPEEQKPQEQKPQSLDMVFYVKNPDGTKTYINIVDAEQLARAQQRFQGRETKILSLTRKDVLDWLEKRGVNLRKFWPGAEVTVGAITGHEGMTEGGQDDEKIGGRYAPDEFDVMVRRLRQRAEKQEKERGPVDIAKLAQRLRDIERKQDSE